MKYLFILAATAMLNTAQASTVNADDLNDRRPRRGEWWECAANNTRRSGPYYGEGPSEDRAKHEALSTCREHSVFPCWPVPGSCIRID